MEAPPSDKLLNELINFVSNSLLHWIEVMSLLAATPDAVLCMSDAYIWAVSFPLYIMLLHNNIDDPFVEEIGV